MIFSNSLLIHLMRGGVSNSEQRLIEIISQDQPLMIARFGSVELGAFVNYLQVVGKLKDSENYSLIKYLKDECFPNWYSIATRTSLSRQAGFFPCTNEMLTNWGKMVLNDINDLDVLLTWLGGEKYIKSYLNGCEKIYNSYIYFPFLFANPWTIVLENKKVLVISPFAETIESQYEKRKKLFKDQTVLPQFDLKTIKAYNVLGGVNPYPNISNWFDALEDMKRQIDETDFDIALIGCGAYAFNLAAHVKRKGKKGITLCGGLQTLFGIYGARHEEDFKKFGILNEYWVRPRSNERPSGFQNVENGAYW